MAEKPILCAAPVVRAILDGRQTQDRRPIKPQPPAEIGGALTGGYWFPTHDSGDPAYKRALCYDGEAHFRRGMPIDFGPWAVGDVLYVRETWAFRADGSMVDVSYGADGGRCRFDVPNHWRAPAAGMTGEGWVPSIHMPKWAARIHLRVLSVGVECVGDITLADAREEGCDGIVSFAALWDGLYGRGSFIESPWCWVTRFERVTP